jgi:hypothetical protein
MSDNLDRFTLERMEYQKEIDRLTTENASLKRELEAGRDRLREETQTFCEEMSKMFGVSILRLGDAACFMGQQAAKLATAQAERDEAKRLLKEQLCRSCGGSVQSESDFLFKEIVEQRDAAQARRNETAAQLAAAQRQVAELLSFCNRISSTTVDHPCRPMVDLMKEAYGLLCHIPRPAFVVLKRDVVEAHIQAIKDYTTERQYQNVEACRKDQDRLERRVVETAAALRAELEAQKPNDKLSSGL